MAVAVPFLAALGGGSAVAGGVIAASAVAGIASGVMSAQAQRNAGIAERQMNTAQRRQEADAARQREVLRRQDLLKALANQNATAGALGIKVAGSTAAIANRDIRDARNDLMVDRVNTKRSAGILRAAGRNAATAGNTAANVSLIDTASRAAVTFGGGFPKAPKAPSGPR